MKEMLKYKGYYGSIHFDEDDLILFGKVVISYEGKSAAEIKSALDDYLV